MNYRSLIFSSTVFWLCVLGVAALQPCEASDRDPDPGDGPACVENADSAGFFEVPARGEATVERRAERHGVVADFTLPNGQTVRRVVERPQLLGSDVRVHADISEPATRVVWSGMLQTGQPGRYELVISGAGQIQVELAGQQILSTHVSRPSLLACRAVQLEYGRHAVSITWHGVGSQSVLTVAWRGPDFGFEPIPTDRWSCRESDPSASDGRTLIQRNRCDACHGGAVPPGVPSLQAVRWLNPDWTVRHLEATANPSAPSAGRTMPYFDLSRDQARDVVAYLWKAGTSDGAPNVDDYLSPAASSVSESDDSVAGQELFATIGCLACHRWRGVGVDDSVETLFGGDLTHVGNKRSVDFLSGWLKRPARYQPAHRMPIFDLNDQEIKALTNFLGSCRSEIPGGLDESDSPSWLHNPTRAARGEEVFTRLRCGACHDASRHRMTPLSRLEKESDWAAACGTDELVGRPSFALTRQQRKSLRAGNVTRHEIVEGDRAPLPGDWLKKQGCTNCHAYASRPGIAAIVPNVIQVLPDLARHASAMSPPTLNAVGAKLHHDVLKSVIAGPERVRPYLKVRMPCYAHLPQAEVAMQTSTWLRQDRAAEPASRQAADRVPVEALPAPPVVRRAGTRLVTSEGFGCVSCHAIGASRPSNDEVRSRGPNLQHIGRRIRRTWFESWLDDPARIAPRIEMPAVKIPVPGVLGDNLKMQIASVWEVLGDPNFEPPPGGAFRILRQLGGMPGRDARALIATDQCRDDQQAVFVKPLVVGLANRNNLLWDLERSAVARWWHGDVAQQRIEGKEWYWQVPTDVIWETPQAGRPAIRLSRDLAKSPSGHVRYPETAGQYLTELDRWWFDGPALHFRYRLRFDLGTHERATVIFTEVLAPLPGTPATAGENGFQRSCSVAQVPAGWHVEWRVGSPRDGDGRMAGLRVPLRDDGHAWAEVRRGGHCQDAWWRGVANVKGDVSFRLAYVSSLPVDSFPQTQPPAAAKATARSQDVAPGFDVLEVPLPPRILPTALAARDGVLYVASLDGAVYRVEDRDGDAHPEQVTVFVDGLAAPYGVSVHQDHVDVINKYALLRLRDRDDDGAADAVRTLASGWGHTPDYHDWAVGLPQDSTGNYYIATACYMNDRPSQAARWRGNVLKLAPRIASSEQPHAFRIQTLTSGHRYPMGLALSHRNQLFVTDNQGNYNPFNELNHVRPGAKFGFVNGSDRTPVERDIAPPSVKLPHPWTRSVNGICFLETPPTSAQDTEQTFGPFAGHLIGCEYDLRRLVRISLQQTNGGWQGAVYPLTRSNPGGDALLGPICATVGPDGEIYIGSMRESGWGAGNNVGAVSVMRLRKGAIPLGIAEVRARKDGFELRFTNPLPVDGESESTVYHVESFTRVPTPDYGGRDVERRTEVSQVAGISADRTRVFLKIESLRPGFVYEIHVQCQGDAFHPDKAYYTLNHIP